MLKPTACVWAVLALAVMVALAPGFQTAQAETEIRQYQGQTLSSFNRSYDNSINGPQEVDPKTYRLEVGGKVAQPLSLTYEQVLALPAQKKVLTLPCVEGWSEKLLFEGGAAGRSFGVGRPPAKAQTVIFYAADGYSSALPLSYLKDKDILLAYRINGLTLDEARAFPSRWPPQNKLGYKWVKWVDRIELSEGPYLGYWEQLGYDNDADTTR